MKNAFDILKDLNEIYVDMRKFEDINKYKSKCLERFGSQKYSIKIADELHNMNRYMQIEHIDNTNRLISPDKIITELVNGNIKITSYGRSYIDVSTSGGHFYDMIKNGTEKIENLKNNLLTQMLTIMGILVAIVAFIFQGIEIVTKTDFLDKCFEQQLRASFALYLPLIVIILCFCIIGFLISKIKRN